MKWLGITLAVVGLGYLAVLAVLSVLMMVLLEKRRG